MPLMDDMHQQLRTKTLLSQAKEYAFKYLEGLNDMDVFPLENALKNLDAFDEELSLETGSADAILKQLHLKGAPATVAQSGGRYFGFVNGSSIPVSMAVKWISDVWDQNGGLFNTSPINSKLESVCERWLVDIFNLPKETVAGFVSGTSMANFSGLAAARYQLLKNLGWDFNEKGLNGAPAIRIVAHNQVHSSIRKTLVLLGFGKVDIEWIESDSQGRMCLDKIPTLDATCLVILQAGNANTGSFDHFDSICNLANACNAWVHIDGAFGLWAAASKSLSHLTKGIEKADSWAVDGHKTLNTPYDSGIVLCKHPQSLINAMQATGEYLVFSEQRDPLLYTSEMSKRSRAIELWATLKYLGKQGIDELVSGMHAQAIAIRNGLRQSGFEIVNDVVFNQVLVALEDDQKTNSVVNYIQNSGEAWLGGSKWQGRAVIRISLCSWVTTSADIERTIALFKKAKEKLL